jgi:hypothetical protein
MAISLYDASVVNFLQILGGVTGFLERGLEHCRGHGIDPNEIVETRLIDDMLPFQFQVRSVAHHSVGAIEGVRQGSFSPGPRTPTLDYPALQKLVADATAALEAMAPDEINALEGKDVVFQAGELRVPFVAEAFLMSFSLTNLHFHATTAYDILRMKGVKLGKRDYMGRLRAKR